MRTLGRGVLPVLIFAVAVVGIVCAGAGVAVGWTPRGLAKVLLARDPGARLDANTIVGIDPRARLLGVHDRPNFIIALATGETIRSSAEDDELGALGRNVTIIAGGTHQLVVGGPHGRLVTRGGGHDLLFVPKNDARVLVQSPRDEVVLAGRRDRVVCGPHVDVTIYKRKSDSVSRSCRAGGKGHVLPLSQAHLAADGGNATAHAAAVTGDGSNDNPYVAPCADPSQTDCTVDAFPARKNEHLWSGEYVPAYQCPGDHPYLLNKDYTPFGSRIPLGVEVEGLGPYGVSIHGVITQQYDTGQINYATGKAIIGYLWLGTKTGAGESSVTNWADFEHKGYKVILHCTSTRAHAARS